MYFQPKPTIVYQPPLLSLVSALTNPDHRQEAARIVARHAGAEDLLIFVRDLELDTLLPAPGFIQTLPNARQWHDFVRECEIGHATNRQLSFPGPAGETQATGIAGEDGSVLVLLGGTPNVEIVLDIALLLPLLAAAFEGERRAIIAKGSARIAKQAADQAKLLATSLETARSALRTALSDAEEANRAKDRFLAALSHELRTPLTPVLIAVTALERESELSELTRHDLEMIRRNVELEVNLIDDLLDLSRVISGKLRLRRETLDLNTLAAQALEICAPYLLEKKIRLETDLSPAALTIVVDATRVQQVLWNLLKNAVKFTPENGSLSVKTTAGVDGIARFIVRDSGVGIEPEALTRIFGIFEQGNANTPREFGGLGLGLAISKAITNAHGGGLLAESPGLGKGATFTVELPLTAPVESGQSLQPSPIAPANPGHLARILVAEDHRDTAQLLMRILHRAGHGVKTVASVTEALESLKTERFDLLLSDVGLPDASGYELMQSASKLYGIAGIAMSGFGMDDDIRRSLEAGFAEHLTKPLDIQHLKQVIQRVLTAG
ncbi:MAG: hypothetical protein JWL90_1090 [Chthoniobacteraceae bacterium]|nr:hypothetical protein [Chthoniobacteraceae bacterium]